MTRKRTSLAAAATPKKATYSRKRKQKEIENDSSDASDKDEDMQNKDEEQNDESEQSEPEPSSEEEQHDDDRDLDFKFVEKKKDATEKKKTPRKKKTAVADADASSTTPKPKAQRKKRVASAKKLNTGKGGKATKKRGKKKKDDGEEEAPSHPMIDNEDPKSMFASVRHESNEVSVTVDEWISTYERNNKKGLAELISFVIHSSGNGATFKEADVEKTNVAEIIENLYEKFPNIVDYPIVSKHKVFKNFGKLFRAFWSTLIANTSANILLKGIFLEYTINWLTSLASSQIRAFRHTATLAIYEIVDALIDVATSAQEELEKKEKQASNAKEKKNKKQEADLVTECEELQEKIEKINETIDGIIESVFAHRYKDTCADIRALSIVSLGGWIDAYSSHFLNDNYLKYLGWTLSDKDPGVRESTIRAITHLYENDEWHGPLVKFTKKFVSRFAEMASDVSISVADEAIKMMTILLKASILKDQEESDKMIEDICSLVFDKNASVRYFAAKFLFLNMSKATAGKKQAKKKSKADIKWDDLLEFIRPQSADMPAVPSLIVDALWNHSETVKDIKAITAQLLDKADELEEEDSLNLVRILNASVKKQTGKLESITSAEDNVKVPKGKRKDKKEEESAVDAMSAHLATSLPELITKYQAEKDKVEELLEIPQYMNLKVYAENNIEDKFTVLLKLIKDMIWRHSDASVFRACASTFKYLLSQDYAQKSSAKTMFDEIIRDMISRLRNAITAVQDEESSQKVAAQIGLQRIEKFIEMHEVRLPELPKTLLEILQKHDAIDLSVQSLKSIVFILQLHISWRLNALLNAESPADTDVESLKLLRNEFISTCCKILESEEMDLAKTCFFALCDQFVLFSPLSLSATLKKLVVLFFPEEIEKLYTFFEKALDIKTDDEKESEEEHVPLVTAIAKALLYSEYETAAKIAPRVLARFVSHEKGVTEAIKTLFGKLRHDHSAIAWNFEYDTLKMVFESYMEDTTNENLEKYSDLAARFAKSHFPGKENNIASVLRTAIDWTFENVEKRFKFLQCMGKYASRCDKQSASEILPMLQGQIKAQKLSSATKEGIESFVEALEHIAEGKKPKTPIRSTTAEKSDDDDDDTTVEQPPKAVAKTPVRSRKGKKSAAKKLELEDDKEEQPANDDQDEEMADAAKEKRGEKRKRAEDSEDETQISQEDEVLIAPPSKKRKT